MADSMFLTNKELVELTDRRQRASQASVLRAMGIEHRIRPDGRVIVLREHVKQQFGARADKHAEPAEAFDWSAA
ncbi:hypothetical protein DR64_797 [Paraburkholderia xenovorans LB400]|nr:DUF4224 domain-containing protein [Paraburkholderia xenovorans]AIP31195.1 hypothetical protein DR64_797 [Paraburkholderia xenovorans LB400]